MINSNRLSEKVGIYSYNYRNKKEYKLNYNIPFISASSIKIFLLDIFLDYMIEKNISLFDKYKSKYFIVEDSPFFKDLNRDFNYFDILKSMIVVSDNTSTNIVIDILGFSKINNYLIKNKYINTKIERKMCDFEKRKNGIDNYTSPEDIFLFFDNLYNFNMTNIYNLISKFKYQDINKENKNITILKILSEQQDLEKIPSGIDLNNNMVLNKPGELPEIRNDSAIILSNRQNIFISIFAENIEDEENSNQIFSEITKNLYSYLI